MMPTVPERFPADVAIFEGVSSVPAAPCHQADLDLERFRAAALNGVMVGVPEVKRRCFADGPHRQLTLQQGVGLTGEWLGVFSADNGIEHVVCTDYFGYANAYYGLAPRADGSSDLLVGSSFRALCAALEARGVRGEIDLSASAAPLTNSMTLYLHRHTFRTFRQGVRVLAPDEALLLSAGGWSLVQRPFFLQPGEADDYETLLRRGIEKAIVEIRTAFDGKVQEYTLGLSGGRDSRAVLALVMAAGRQNDIGITASDPNWAPSGATRDVLAGDLAVSTRIVERYGLTWARSAARPGIRVSAAEHLDRMQHHRGHQSYELTPNSVIQEFRETVDFYGAGGEMFRAHFAHMHKKGYPRFRTALESPHTTRGEQIGALYDALTNPATIEPELFQQGRAVFLETMLHAAAPGDDGYVLMDKHYVLQRGRTHHSTMRLSASVGKTVISPLCQPEFFRANQLLRPEERDWGKVAFDIIDTIDPVLNEVALSLDRWDENLLPLSRLEGSGWKRFDGATAHATWREAMDARTGGGITGLAPFPPLPAYQALLDSLGDDIADVLPASVLHGAAMLADFNANQTYGLVSKLASVKDALGRSDAEWSQTVFPTRGAPRTITSRRAIGAASVEPTFSIRRAELSLAAVTVELQQNADALCVNIGALPGDDLEIAVYWFRDGTRFATVQYGEDIENQLVPGPGRFRVDVFLRRKGQLRAQRVISSPTITIATPDTGMQNLSDG